jgi:hypothetical protein
MQKMFARNNILPNTLCPTLKSLIFFPTDTTSPANSYPQIKGNAGAALYCPSLAEMSAN